MNFIYQRTGSIINFVGCQQLKYFGHFIGHNGLEKTIMQGMVAGKRSRGKPRQRWEEDIADTFGKMAAASRVAEDRQQFRRDILTSICSEREREREREEGEEGEEGGEGGRDGGRERERERD